jgi:O-palmitoleoyl-L-serine hydrolase
LTAEEREQRRKERRREQRQKLTPEEREQKKLERREKRRQQRLLQNMEAKNQTPRAQRSPQENEMNNKNSLPKIIENEPAAKEHQKKRRQQANQKRRMEARNSTRLPKHRRRNQQQQKINTKSPNKRRHGDHNRHKFHKAQNLLVEIKEPKKCGLRLLERCSWPQCNHSCPSLTNPLTGEEIKFLELLTSFGLDMDAVAQALGVDMQTLNNMDHKELIKLFTEPTS